MSDEAKGTEIPAVVESTGVNTSAKEISKWSMVIASIWIAALSLVKALWGIFGFSAEFGLSMNEIIMSGITLAAIFTPVYLSIVLDKIKDMRLGGDK
jgi:magnesium-transporting ATPase (P-type)